MKHQFKVPGLSADSADKVKDVILTAEPDASVAVDLEQQIITVETEASDESIRQLIVSVGQEVA
ncbi:MAG: copper chaperone [Leptolyngbyaceae cyanobacterium SM1_1_3]|nr:copper chaperone [Leptolyngbyaceae cyanobacterium SM1_1_3]NJN02833.1 copper chaperone [Leptolyngbyaceae cyanobacterium RM1_1_2]NJO11604.1 copper chaperone [Leptolyngbyaceae cyanobacterium SL_1_1]